MAEDLIRYLHQVINRVKGLLAVVITDRDGVPVLKAAHDAIPDLALKQPFLSAVGMATDQAGKLGLGKSKRIICVYGNYQVIHFNKFPLMVTMIARSETNTGMLLSLDTELSQVLQELRPIVEGQA